MGTTTARARPAGGRPSLTLSMFLPYQLAFSVGVISRVLATELRRGFGLNVAEWRVMAILGSFAPLSTRTLARYSAMEKSKISRATSRLIARGFVVRSADPTDKRLLLLHFSARGKRLYERMAAVALDYEQALLHRVGADDAAGLVKTLTALREAAQAFEAERAPARRPRRPRAATGGARA